MRVPAAAVLGLLAVLAPVLAPAPASAAPALGVVRPAIASLRAPLPAPAHDSALPAARGVESFSFSSFSADYYLDRDENGRSRLRTVERLTAVFPDFDQNHGIRRALVEDYLGAPTDLEVVSVTDQTGADRDYETESDEGILLVTIAAHDYLHGEQTYIITYEQRNVTGSFPAAGGGSVDEFQWDTNGTLWQQSFAEVTARVHLPADLAATLTGDAACYVGVQGAADPCDIAAADDGNETVFTASERDLGPGENVTVAIGFAAGTFVPRDDSLFGSPFGAILLLSLVLLLASAVWAVAFRVLRLRSAPGRGIVVPQYLALPEPDLLVSAVLLGKTARAVPATLVGLAVRGVLRLVEEQGKRGKPRFAVQFVSWEGRPRLGGGPRGASDTERELVHAILPDPTAGARAALDGSSPGVAKRVTALTQRLRARAVEQGYQRMPPRGPRAAIAVLTGLGAIGTGSSAAILLATVHGGAVPAVALFALPLAVLGFLLPAHRPLTPAGVEVRDHLRGVRVYLTLAEAERFQMLQSPEGAERRVTDGQGGVVALYEQLLPHAVLFSVERQWAEVLGRFYEQTGERPDWYAGSSSFNAAAFSAGIGGVAASAASAYSSSTSSSSSGGSSGGGSSGGGGGGGGGGGV